MQATHEYHKLLETILRDGIKKGDRTGTGTTSIFDYKIKFDMSQGFPLITTKKIHTKSIIHELLWFLKGDTNVKYLQDNGVTIWDEWADKNGNLGPVYGKQWVTWDFYKRKMDGGYWDEINQIQNAIDMLKENPDSRRIIVSAWNPGDIDKMALPPCHWAFELYTEEMTIKERHQYCKDNDITLGMLEAGLENVYDDMMANGVPTRKISLKWHQRSVDTFLGLPFNIASYAFLLHMFAQVVNMVPDKLIGDLTNVHIYMTIILNMLKNS